MEWARAPDVLRAPESEVHVWGIDLTEPSPDVGRLAALLSQREWARANRLEPAPCRDRFVLVHAAVRLILDEYLGGALGQAEFLYGPHGKPDIPILGPPAGRLAFNLSHSRDMALCAVARGRRVGVDAEYMRTGASIEQIAEQICAPAELTAFRQILPEQKTARFFQCWARKEACAKAAGLGLTVPLRRWAVGWEPVCELAGRADPEPVTLTVRDLEVGARYAAALAAEGSGWTLGCWRWTWQRVKY